MKRISLVAALLSAGALCVTGCQAPGPQDSIEGGLNTQQHEILGGAATKNGDFPTVVALVVDNGRRGLCTGTFVAPEWILTAAHCIHPQTLGYSNQQQVTAATVVVFDAVDLQSAGSGKIIAAAETIPHPGFRQPGNPDVGLVRLAQPVTDRDPSPINTIRDDAPIGIEVQMVGFGVADNGNAGKQFALQSKTSVGCASFQISNDMFLCFSQTDKTGKCSGDSGGPSFADIGGQQKVVGITSFGDQNCQILGADMRVDASLDFIGQHAPELLCQDDSVCEDGCGENGLPADPDCPTCDTDDDCEDPSTQFCDLGFCAPRPNQPGGLGSDCGDPDAVECYSGICANGPEGSLCTQDCSLDANDCPDGFACQDAGGRGVCWPAEGGGGGGSGICQAGGDAGAAQLLLIVGALLLVIRRRGQATRRRGQATGI